MDFPECSGCRVRDARIAELERRLVDTERRLATLEVRLKTNASNSSTPPSANPPGTPPPVRKKTSKRRRGGQPGHPPHLKQLLPADRVTRTEHFTPIVCDHCQTPLSPAAASHDPPPKRFQVVELPPVVAEVVEYQAHTRTCSGCGHATAAVIVIPAAIRAHSVGPRLTAALSYFSGCHGVSKRGVEEIAETVLGLPIALGTVAHLEREVSAALEPAHREAMAAVRQAEVKFADETGWKLWGKLCWLWAAATAGVAAFVIHPGRGAAGLTALLGEDLDGIVHSDRWHVYLQVPPERRQLCGAHLKRDFRKIAESGGPGAFVGRRGGRIVKELFVAWHRFQAGIGTRPQLQAMIASLERRLQRALVEGMCGSDAKVGKFCENVLNLETALWTFTRVEGVEPTNNFMERLVRRAVLWRRRSFGCNSIVGCRFVERILTVVQTCRLNEKNTMDYLAKAVTALRDGKPCPSLLEKC